MNKKRIFYIILTGLLLLSLQSIEAFQLSPISVSMTPSGPGAKQSFKIVNSSDKPEAVLIYMAVRDTDIDGMEINVDAEDDFSLYPGQIILMPNTTKTIRLEWIGNPNPGRELAYRIIVEQVPINFEEEKPGATVNINIKYMGAVYIAPEGAEPDIVIGSAVRQEEADGTEKLVILVHNRGTAHSIIKDFTIHLNDGIKLHSSDLKGMNGSNILAGHVRRFVLPWPVGLNNTPLAASIEFIKKE